MCFEFKKCSSKIKRTADTSKCISKRYEVCLNNTKDLFETPKMRINHYLNCNGKSSILESVLTTDALCCKVFGLQSWALQETNFAIVEAVWVECQENPKRTGRCI